MGLTRTRVALAVAAIAVTASCARSSPDKHTFSRENGTDPGTLEIVVTEGGVERAATISCGSQSNATGYFSSSGNSSACVTALMSFSVTQFIEKGKLPPKRRCAGPVEPLNATMRFSGRWVEKDIDRTLVVNSDCTATLWRDLQPLREPTAQPLIIREQ